MKIRVVDYEWPTLIVSARAYQEMCALVDAHSKEVGWHCSVFYDEESNSYIVDRTFIHEQTVTSAETDATAEALAKLQKELLEAGLEDHADNLLLWGHSHVNMDVSPSGTDIDTFADRYSQQPDVFIMWIMNKRREVYIEVYMDGMLVEDYPWKIDLGYDKEAQELVEDAASKVKNKVLKLSTGWAPSAKKGKNHTGEKLMGSGQGVVWDDPLLDIPERMSDLTLWEQQDFESWCEEQGVPQTDDQIEAWFTENYIL